MTDFNFGSKAIKGITPGDRRPLLRQVSKVLAFIGMAVALFAMATIAAAQTTVYNAIPSPLAPNYASQGYQATSTAEMGDYVHLAGTNRIAKTVTFTMSEWALESTPGNVAYCSSHPGTCSASGWNHPFTLNIYNIGPALPGGVRNHGSLIASVTQVKTIPWRPAADPTCATPTAWRAPDSLCYNGLAFNLSFDLSNVYVNLPNDIVIGLAFNTQTYGTAPMGVDGPYSSLNLALTTNGASVGTDDNIDNIFWSTSNAGFYTDSGAAGSGFLREDTVWTPYGTLPIQVMTIAPPTPQIINASLSSPLANPNAWVIYDDETDTVNNALGSMVSGPATPPLGTGSAQISVTGTQRRNLATYQFSGTPLASIGTLRFSTYNPSAGNGGGPNRSGYLGFNVDFNGSDTFQNRLNFNPQNNGAIIQNSWQEWDTIAGGAGVWGYSKNTTWPIGIGGGGEPSGTAPGAVLKTWAQILSQYPNARIRVTDSFLGIRVGEPYNDGYTENIDAIKFGTSSFVKYFNFDPQPPVTYVDDSWTGTTPGTDPDGAGPATNFGYDGFATIQGGIDGVNNGGTVNVAGGTYNEDVAVNKTVVLSGAGATVTTIRGPAGGSSVTVQVTANGSEVRGFRITRAGNALATWNDPTLNTAGVAVQGQAVTGMNLHDNILSGNRSAIDINNSNGHSIHNNVITGNHTGVIFRNQTDNITFEQNEVTSNRTVGVLFLDGSGGSNVPVQTAANCSFFNNNISGNWYGGIVDRQSGGSIPAPGTLAKNFSGNWYGTAAPAVTTANSAEPGYASLIPVEFGGSATAPGGQPDIAGPASANFDYTPYLATGGDTAPGVFGFQGSFASLNISATSAQSGAASKLQEANDLITAGGVLSVPTATYPGNVTINKAITVQGSFTVSGVFAVTAAGATISPGNSPGIINTGNFSLVAGSNLNIEINGNIAGAQYDQVNVTGSVSLGGANLNTTLGYVPTAGHTYTIINNDGGDAVTGTFAGLPEGTVFFLGANSFRISYVGGSGNDVVLTAVSLCNTVSMSNTITTLTGTTVNVPINVDNTTGNALMSADFVITYNPSVVTFNSFSLGTVTAGSGVNINTSTSGVIVVSLFNATAWTGAGTLGNITFNAVGLPGTSSPVSFSSFKFNEGTPCLTTTNGLVTVVGGTITGTITYGNPASGAPVVRNVPGAIVSGAGSPNVSSAPSLADGTYSLSGFGSGTYTRSAAKTGGQNGAISAFDAAKISRSVVGLETLNATQTTVADVSGTGGVTSFDAAMIARYSVMFVTGTGATGNWTFSPTYGPSTVFANISGENYTALLMGDVSGNWNDPASLPNPPRSSADETQKLSAVAVERVSGATDSEIVVPINVAEVAGKEVTAYEFVLRYDPAVIVPATDPVSSTDTISSGLVVTTNATEAGVLRVSVFGAMPLSGDGVLLNIKFTGIGKAGSVSPLTFERLILNEGDPRSKAIDGEVRLIESNSAEISGRVLTAMGQPLARAAVTLTDTTRGVRTTVTDQTGSFRFGGLQTGETYTITASAKRFTFAPMTVSIVDQAMSVDMIAQP